MKIMDINLIYKSLEDLDFERFDKIFEKVETEKAVFRKEDIIPLCRILAKPYRALPYEDMDPHQYVKIRKMTIFTVEYYNPEESFLELAKGAAEMVKTNIGETQSLFAMTMNSFPLESITILGGGLDAVSLVSKEKLAEVLLKMIERNPERFKEKGTILLNYVGE